MDHQFLNWWSVTVHRTVTFSYSSPCTLLKQKKTNTGRCWSFSGRCTRTWTLSLRFWRPPLYQLSYTPIYYGKAKAWINWWAFRDSNPGLSGYEPEALTNWAKGPYLVAGAQHHYLKDITIDMAFCQVFSSWISPAPLKLLIDDLGKRSGQIAKRVVFRSTSHL